MAELPHTLDWRLWLHFLRLILNIILAPIYAFFLPYSAISKDLPPNIHQLLQQHGIIAEEHHVHTEDGFVLVLFRCFLQKTTQHAQYRPPVLLMHGLHQSAECFAALQHMSLPKTLLLAGFDVWLGNSRGNKYSCKHKLLSPRDHQYWNFSIDEMASIDIPAQINYILSHSAFSNIGYIGFSQGSAMGFAAFSSNPALARRIAHFCALSPAATLHGIENEVLSKLVSCSPELMYLLFGRHCAIPYVLLWQRWLPKQWFNRCVTVSCKILFGWDLANIALEDRDATFATLYSFCSVKSTVHWFQILNSKRFQMYDDHGGKHGHVVPRYPLESIACTMSIFYGGRDLNLIDVRTLLSQLPENKLSQVYVETDYEHLDPLYARSAETNVFPQVVQLMEKAQWTMQNSRTISNAQQSVDTTRASFQAGSMWAS